MPTYPTLFQPTTSVSTPWTAQSSAVSPTQSSADIVIGNALGFLGYTYAEAHAGIITGGNKWIPQTLVATQWAKG